MRVATMNVRSSKPTALCRGGANALASPCASVKAILTAYSRAQGEDLYALDGLKPIVEIQVRHDTSSHSMVHSNKM